MDDWNYLAARVDGDGTIEVIETELPIEISSIARNLSAPPTMSGTITNEVKRLKKNGQPIFQPWNTAILAEADGEIRGAGMYRRPTFNGATWNLDIIGFTGYAQGQTYESSKFFIDADPLDIFRHIWEHLQSLPNGNLGITIDPLKSPKRVGTQIKDVEFQTGEGEMVAFEAGPRKLNWYETFDLGKEIDDYAKETPFDWLEATRWLGDTPHCHISLGHPKIGSRNNALRFVLGENLGTDPSATSGDYVNQVHVLGAGEGRAAIRGYAGISDGRVRRSKTVQDKSLKSKAAANARAARELAATRGELVVERIDVYDHPNAPLEAIQLGSEYLLYAETDHTLIDQYVRVVGRAGSPDSSDTEQLMIVRAAA